MRGFLSEGLRDVVAILSLIVGIVQLLLAFKPALRRVSQTVPTVLPGLANGGLVAALKTCWNDTNNDVRPTLALVGTVFVINTLIVLIFNVANEAMAGFALLKDIGLAYSIGEIDGWLKKNGTKRDLHSFRALVATLITIVLIVPPLFLALPSRDFTRLQSLYFVEVIGFVFLGLVFTSFYAWQGVKSGWKIITG